MFIQAQQFAVGTVFNERVPRRAALSDLDVNFGRCPQRPGTQQRHAPAEFKLPFWRVTLNTPVVDQRDINSALRINRDIIRIGWRKLGCCWLVETTRKTRRAKREKQPRENKHNADPPQPRKENAKRRRKFRGRRRRGG